MTGAPMLKPLKNNVLYRPLGSYKSSTMIWFTAFLLLGILGVLFALDMHFDHENRALLEQEKLATQASVVAANASHQLIAAEHVLDQIREGLDKARKDGQALNRELRALASAMPGVRAIGIIDADGKMLYTNQAHLIGQNLSHREYFQTIKKDPNPDRLYVSRPFNTEYGAWLITIAKMIPQPDDSMGGVIVAAFNPDYFNTLLQSVLYAPDMWASITDGDGGIFVIAPNDASTIGRNLAVPESLFSRHMESGLPSTVLTGRAMTTGRESMVAHITLKPFPGMDHALVVAAGRSLDDIYAPWREELKTKLGLYLMLIAISISGVYGYQSKNKEYERKMRETEAALMLSEDKYRLIVENTSELIIKVNPEGFYTYVNPAFCDLYGTRQEDLIGRHYSQDVFEDDQSIVAEFFEKLFKPPYSVTFVHREKTVAGIRYLEWRGHVIRDEEGQIREVVGVARDVTERVETMARLQEQAQTDYLTGLYNRRYFMEQGQIELARARRYGKPLSIFMIDIDHFKKINDTYGHNFGDLVLQRLSIRMRESLRTIDIIGRLGGEEFAVLLPETELRGALEVAERLRDSVARINVERAEGMPVNFTISIGVASIKDDTNLDTLLSQADQAMYEAKQTGRNKVNAAA